MRYVSEKKMLSNGPTEMRKMWRHKKALRIWKKTTKMCIWKFFGFGFNLFETLVFIIINNWEQACGNAGTQVSRRSQRVK